MKRWKRLGVASPWLSLVILMSEAAVTGLIRVNENSRDSTNGDIRANFSVIPTRLGGDASTWLFLRDVDIPTSQVEKLKLRSFVSRIYRRVGGDRRVEATIFFAQTANARAMAGHHPPRCYPSIGWQLVEGETKDLDVVRADGKPVRCRVYHFASRAGHNQELWVVSGFVLPTGEVCRSLDEIGSVFGRAEESERGLVQFQLLFEGDHDFTDVHDYATSLLRSLPSESFEQFMADQPGRDDSKVESLK